MLATASANGKSLSPGEAKDLARLESVIDRGRHTFQQVALAILEIRDRKLYRAEFATFEAYCRERWAFSRSQGHRLAQAAETIQKCEQEGLPAPESEYEARRLRLAAKTINPLAPSRLRPGSAEERRQIAERIDSQTPGLATGRSIAELLQKLRTLHATHPHRSKADQLLDLYRDTVLPFPPFAIEPEQD